MSERGLAEDGAWDWCGQLSRGRLTVGVVEARNLAGKKAGGLSDPYCTVAVAGAGAARRAERTGCVRGDLNPVWDVQLEVAVPDPAALLTVTVWSRSGGLLPDRFLGRVVLEVASLPDRARPHPPSITHTHTHTHTHTPTPLYGAKAR
jgi:Ca2+-dependent lipid-binding protein